jgi:hypothetical protein
MIQYAANVATIPLRLLPQSKPNGIIPITNQRPSNNAATAAEGMISFSNAAPTNPIGESVIEMKLTKKAPNRELLKA